MKKVKYVHMDMVLSHGTTKAEEIVKQQIKKERGINIVKYHLSPCEAGYHGAASKFLYDLREETNEI